MLTYSRSFLDLLLFQLASVLYYFIHIIRLSRHPLSSKTDLCWHKTFSHLPAPLFWRFSWPDFGAGRLPHLHRRGKAHSFWLHFFPRNFPRRVRRPLPTISGLELPQPPPSGPGTGHGWWTGHAAPRPQYTCNLHAPTPTFKDSGAQYLTSSGGVLKASWLSNNSYREIKQSLKLVSSLSRN